MKIVIPISEDKEEAEICPSFGRAPFFLMIDTQTGKKNRFENLAASSAGGAGIAAAQIIVDQGAEAVLAPRCGENAAKVLVAANIKLFKTVGESITENIDAFNAGSLSELDNIHPGFHHHGG